MFNTDEQFKMTIKTRIFLWLYDIFEAWGQWFINNCDTEPLNLEEYKSVQELFEDNYYKEPDYESNSDTGTMWKVVEET